MGSGRQPGQNDCANSVAMDEDDVTLCPDCQRVPSIKHVLADMCAWTARGGGGGGGPVSALFKTCRLRILRSAKTLRRFGTSTTPSTLVVSMAYKQHVWNVFQSKMMQRSISRGTDFNPSLTAAFWDFRFRTSRPVARAKLIQMG